MPSALQLLGMGVCVMRECCGGATEGAVAVVIGLPTPFPSPLEEGAAEAKKGVLSIP